MKKYLIPIIALVYILSPIDLIPDFVPVFGWLDDVVAFLIGLRSLLGTLKRMREGGNHGGPPEIGTEAQ